MAIFFVPKKVIADSNPADGFDPLPPEDREGEKRLAGLAFWIEERDNTDDIARTVACMPSRRTASPSKPQQGGRPEKYSLQKMTDDDD